MRDTGSAKGVLLLLFGVLTMGCESQAPIPISGDASSPQVQNLLIVGERSCSEGRRDPRIRALLEAQSRERRDAGSDSGAPTLLDVSFRQLGQELVAQEDWCQAAILLGNAGDRLFRSNPIAARDRYRLALEMAFRARSIEHAAGILNDLGLLESRQQRVRQALEHFAGARMLWRHLGEPTEWANTHLNVGAHYFRMGRWRAARQVLDESCDLLRFLGRESQWKLAVCLTWRGRLETARGSYPRAERDLDEALEIRRNLSGDRLAPGLDALGYLRMASGDLDAAAEFFERARDVADSDHDRAHSDGNLAEVYLRRGSLERALALSSRSMGIVATAGIQDPNLSLHNLFVRARAHDALGRPDLSSVSRERLLATLEGLRSAGQGELLLPFLSHRRKMIDFFVHQLARAGEEEEAFELTELVRARGLLDQLIWPSSDVRGVAAESLLVEDAQVRVELDRLARAIGSQLEVSETDSGGGSEEPAVALSTLVSQSRQLRFRLMGLEAEMRQAAGAQGASGSGLQDARHLLVDETLLLVFWLGEYGGLLWEVTRHGFRLHEGLPSGPAVERSTQALLGLIAKGLWSGEPARQEARSLSRALLGPVAKSLVSGRPLTIIADGPLALLPFSTLPHPATELKAGLGRERDADEDPLVAHHAITIAPSISTAKAIRNKAAQRQQGQAALLTVFADPVYGFGDPRSPSPSPGLERSIGHSLPGLERLESSGLEADAIALRRNLRPHVGLEASKSTVLGGAARNSRFVHFGTHARIDAEAPELSAIELSRVDAAGRRIEGTLRLRDLDQLELVADMVSLAGCDTALGEFLPGEGVLALPRGFLHAGAGTVVASLWNVSDVPTAALVEEIYRQLIDVGASPSEALRQAQLSLARGSQWHDPVHWAAFVLIGDWEVRGSPKS